MGESVYINSDGVPLQICFKPEAGLIRIRLFKNMISKSKLPRVQQ